LGPKFSLFIGEFLFIDVGKFAENNFLSYVKKCFRLLLYRLQLVIQGFIGFLLFTFNIGICSVLKFTFLFALSRERLNFFSILSALAWHTKQSKILWFRLEIR
jgi:hypothetical protein